jgi:hypothetical protein
MAAQRQPKKWPPRSLPTARETRARSGSRTFLCPANYRRYASRAVQPAAPKRRAIEFCFCFPPVSPGLVFMRFVNTISMPFASMLCQKGVICRLPANLTSGPAPTTLPEEVLRHWLPARPSLLSDEAVGPLRLTPGAVNIVCGRGVSYLSPRRGGHDVHSSPNRCRQPEHHERDNNQ